MEYDYMGNTAGYQWSIEERDGQWTWSILAPEGQTSLVTGAALSRAHAAACVVRALILGVTVDDQAPSLAA
jgi:hypothetical protein